MKKMTKIQNGSVFVLVISLACVILLTHCMSINDNRQMSEVVNSIDWSNDWSGIKFNRIISLISTQEGQDEFFNLLDSEDAFTIVNTAVLIGTLTGFGHIHDPQKSRTISALNRVISGSDSEYKSDAILALDNTASNFIFSYKDDRDLEERLTDEDVALIYEIVDSLIVALNDENDQIKYFAAQSIHHYGLYAAHAESELIGLLESENIEVRLSAAGSIGHINPDTSIDVIPIILDGLRNWDRNSLRNIAIKALEKIRNSDKEVVDTLIQLIVTENNILRETSIEALIELHPEPENIIPQLFVLLNNEDSNIRIAANRILSEYEVEDRLE